jgi:PAS domain-containing protein
MNESEPESRAKPQQAPTKPEGQLQQVIHRLKLADLIFDHIENGALVTDADGYILYFNRPYASFLGIKQNRRLANMSPRFLKIAACISSLAPAKPKLTRFLKPGDEIW